MFLRCHSRKKHGKAHRYWSVVESRRCRGGRPVPRQDLYLGEINDGQASAWKKTISVFDEHKQQYEQLSLFPSDRPIPSDELNALSVVLSELRLTHPRSFGDCWLGCLLWDELGLSDFWEAKLADKRGRVLWRKVLQLLAVNRRCAPGSECAVHRHGFTRSAMDELLGVDFAAADKDRLSRCLDRLLPHKDELCRPLTQRWKTLFDANFDVLPYDLTRTYFEGRGTEIPKAKYGYSRDGRPDCRQGVIARGVTTDGLPLAYEVLAQSADRQKKEQAMRRRKLKRLIHGLNRLKRRPISRDSLLKKIAVLQKEAGRAASFVKIREPKVDEEVNRKTFTCTLDRAAWSQTLDRDGSYILRAYLPWDGVPQGRRKQAGVLWGGYMQLVQVEEAFKTLKGDLSLRPIHPQTEQRVEAHIFVAFLGYCLTVTLRLKLQQTAPGLTPREVLRSLSAIQWVDVELPTTDGRVLVLPRHTDPEPRQRMILDQLKLTLPTQPPPRVTAAEVTLPTGPSK